MIRRCRRRTAVAATCALGALGALSLAPAAMAGKPAPAAATAADDHRHRVQRRGAGRRGRRRGARAARPARGARRHLEGRARCPPTGGMDHDSLLERRRLRRRRCGSARTSRARTPRPSGDRSHSTASVADLGLGVGVFSPSLLRVEAGVLRSSALAKCGANGAELSGRSEILGLRLAIGNGLFADVLVTSAPNQVIKIQGVAKITINKQVVTANSIDVSALRDRADPAGGPHRDAAEPDHQRQDRDLALARGHHVPGWRNRRRRRARSRTGSRAAARSSARMPRSIGRRRPAQRPDGQLRRRRQGRQRRSSRRRS